MLIDRYTESIDELFKRAITSQRKNIEEASRLIVECVKNGGNVHVFDTGHIINSELICRAGGLAFLKPLKYTLTVEDPVREIDRKGMETSMEGLGEYVLRASKVAPGDVLLLGSVSGKTVNIIDLAIAARAHGVKTICVTSLEYSSAVPPMHSSGKKLYDLGDVVIDNCAPKGDAMLEVEGLDYKFAPASGMAAAYLMWCLSAQIVEDMLKEDMKPTIFKSVNFPGGPELYKEMCERYEKTGM